jgi:hypothetical protein
VAGRYEPGTSCILTYRLTSSPAGEVPYETLGVVEIHPSRVLHRFFHDDPLLPELALAVERQLMRPGFSTLLDEQLGVDLVDVTRITPVAYKPGWSCVLRYDLDTIAGKQTMFGKLFGTSAEGAFDRARVFHNETGFPGKLRVPRPVAEWGDMRMLITQAIQGSRGLNLKLFEEGSSVELRERWMYELGAGLARFHEDTTTEGPRRTLERDIRALFSYAPAVAFLAPDLGQLFEQSTTVLAGLATGVEESDPRPSHGSLRTDQVLIAGGELVVMDLDGFCWADPARDIANLLAYLDWKAIREPQYDSLIKEIQASFVEGYASVRSAPEGRSFALYRAASMLKIVGRRHRDLTYMEWPLIPELLDRASEVLVA